MKTSHFNVLVSVGILASFLCCRVYASDISELNVPSSSQRTFRLSYNPTAAQESEDETNALLGMMAVKEVRKTTTSEQVFTQISRPLGIQMEEQPPANPYVVEELIYRSASLSVKFASIMQDLQPTGGNENTANLQSIAIKPGDIRNGLFVIFQSLRLPHRYHAQFYQWSQDAKGKGKLLPDKERNDMMQAFLNTPVQITANIDFFHVSRSSPNYLMIGCEEVDARKSRCGCQKCCCVPYGCLLDLCGKAKAKFENDPLGTIALIVDGASRIARAAAGIPI